MSYRIFCQERILDCMCCISRKICVHYILANLLSKIHIAKIGIAKINGLGCMHIYIDMDDDDDRQS